MHRSVGRFTLKRIGETVRRSTTRHDRSSVAETKSRKESFGCSPSLRDVGYAGGNQWPRVARSRGLVCTDHRLAGSAGVCHTDDNFNVTFRSRLSRIFHQW